MNKQKRVSSTPPFKERRVVLQFLGRDPGDVKCVEEVPGTIVGFYMPHNDGRFVVRADDKRVFHIDPYPYHENRRISFEQAAKELGFEGPVLLSDEEINSEIGDDWIGVCKPGLWKLIVKKIACGEWSGDPTNGPYEVINDWNRHRDVFNTKEQLLCSYWAVSGRERQRTMTKKGVRDEDNHVLPFGTIDERLRGAVVIVGIPGDGYECDDLEQMHSKIRVEEHIKKLK